MKAPSAMLQRTLLLAAFAVFTSAQRPRLSYNLPACSTITKELQEAFKALDPYTFPNISDFTYSHHRTSLLFNFKNARLDDFSNITCEYLGDVSGPRGEVGEKVALLTLNGSHLNFYFPEYNAYGRINGSNEQTEVTSPSVLQFLNYSLALRFNFDTDPQNPLALCIIDGSLIITPYAESVKARFPNQREVEQELTSHPQELVEAVKGYVPRFANGLTKLLNDALCKPLSTTRLSGQPPTFTFPRPFPATHSSLRPFHQFHGLGNPQ